MNYIVYKTTNLINSKYYIGVHCSESTEVFDGYLGSGLYLKNAIKKHGSKNFVRETLVDCKNDFEKAYEIEKNLVKTKEQDINSYNLAPGGVGNSDLGSKYGQIGGTIARDLKLGVHGASKETKSAWGKIGGPLGGAIAKRMQLGIFSEYHQDKLSEYGKMGGGKIRDEKLGIFGLSALERSVNSTLGGLNSMKSNSGIHTLDEDKRSEWATLGGKQSAGSLFYNDGIKNNKFNTERETNSFADFLFDNPHFIAGKIFVNEKRKSNAGKIAYNDGIKEYKFAAFNLENKEEEFENFMSVNPKFVRGRLCNPYKNYPELATLHKGTRFYTDGVAEFKFKSSNFADKKITDSEFKVFLESSPEFRHGRKPKAKSN